MFNYVVLRFIGWFEGILLFWFINYDFGYCYYVFMNVWLIFIVDDGSFRIMDGCFNGLFILFNWCIIW